MTHKIFGSNRMNFKKLFYSSLFLMAFYGAAYAIPTANVGQLYDVSWSNNPVLVDDNGDSFRVVFQGAIPTQNERLLVLSLNDYQALGNGTFVYSTITDGVLAGGVFNVGAGFRITLIPEAENQ
jgi:hypothetical protein